MRGPYVTARAVEQLRSDLIPEEWAVLNDVATMRLAVATDLQRLRGKTTRTEVRTFRRLLARLTASEAQARALMGDRLERSRTSRRKASVGGSTENTSSVQSRPTLSLLT